MVPHTSETLYISTNQHETYVQGLPITLLFPGQGLKPMETGLLIMLLLCYGIPFQKKSGIKCCFHLSNRLWRHICLNKPTELVHRCTTSLQILEHLTSSAFERPLGLDTWRYKNALLHYSLIKWVAYQQPILLQYRLPGLIYVGDQWSLLPHSTQCIVVVLYWTLVVCMSGQ